jgi:small-conductance mechanosensitive channel
MDALSSIAGWRDFMVNTFSVLATKVVGFLPHLVGALLILLLGWGLSRLVEVTARRVFRTLGTDRLASRYRLSERAGLRSAPSEALASLVFWLLMVMFVLSSVQALGLPAVTATLERLVAYVPNLIGAALIAFLGLLLVRLLGSLTSSAAAAASVPGAPRLGFLVRVCSAGLVTILALEQLGIATAILVWPLTVVLAAAGFAAGLAFALGARPIVTHILAGHFLKQSLPREAFVEIGGERGIVERIGATDTLLKNGDKRWSVPNAQLLEHVVVR